MTKKERRRLLAEARQLRMGDKTRLPPGAYLGTWQWIYEGMGGHVTATLSLRFVDVRLAHEWLVKLDPPTTKKRARR